jgi:hypothetical protein
MGSIQFDMAGLLWAIVTSRFVVAVVSVVLGAVVFLAVAWVGLAGISEFRKWRELEARERVRADRAERKAAAVAARRAERERVRAERQSAKRRRARQVN